MTHKRIFLRTLSLVGLVLGVLILTMVMLTSVQADGPAITIAKEADQMVVSGSTVTFTITITNTGDVTLTNVTVSDDLAPTCNKVIEELVAGVSRSYECSRTNVTSDFTNSATVTGTPSSGGEVTHTDTAFVDVINPGIEIAKTPNVQTVASGSTVTFTIAVTNTGDVPLTNVTISDAQAPDCNQTYANLPQGGSEHRSCTVNVTDGFINSAIVTGRPPAGEDVTDADAAKVKLDETLTCRPTDMIAYWRLDETSSATYDDFYYGHDGECAGSHDCPSPATGHVNGGQKFDGSSTGIDVPAVPGDDSFNWGAQDGFSIEFWMQTDSNSTCSGNQVVVGRDDSSTDLHWWTGCWDGGQAAFYLVDTSGNLAGMIGTTDLTDGSWHHVVAVRDASANRILIYVDGIEENSTTATYTDGFDSPTAALNIGWLTDGFHFDGIVDEIALYDKALSADEVRQHYNEGLVGRWYCQGGTFAPTIVSAPVTNAIVGRPYSYDVEAAGYPYPTYALTTYPSGMTINPATGLISWIPTVAQEGSHDVEVEASNSEGTDPQAFTIVVAEGTLCPADMIAYWKLDEPSGSTYDDFYDGHNGTCVGQCPTPTTGHVNGGQEFNGSDTGINVPADAAFDWGPTDSFSIEFWMKRPGAPTGNEVIVGRQGSTHPKPHIWVGVGQWAGNVAAFCLYDTDGVGTCLTGETVVTGGNWHHIVAVRDAVTNRIRVYVDGEEDGSVEPPSYSAGFDTTTPLNIGWLNLSSGYHFAGTVDEVALYDRALSADEIQQHYNDGDASPGYCINPDIAVNKIAHPMVAYLSDTVFYTYTVTNPGDTPLSDVTLSDDKCSPITSPEGDDGNGYLDPGGETWTYHCSMTPSADITNTATVTGTHFLDDTVSNTDTVFVDVINPEIAIGKTADPTIIRAGDTVTYTYTVTNPGDDPLSNVQKVSDDKCSPVTFTGGDSNSNYKLDPGEIWTYTCSMTVNTDIINTATVTGTDSAGGTLSTQATASVDVVSSDISIVKTANPTVIYVGDTVTYTYVVTNLGDNPLSSVSVSDDKCGSVTFMAGDTNSDDLLDMSETWTYRCSTTLDEDTTNTATATGTDSAGYPVSPDTDTAFVDVINPGIEIAKTPDEQTVDSGSTVTFTITVTNTGDVALTDVVVADAQAPNCARTIGDLDAGERTSYVCTIEDVTTDFTNSATATGRPPVGDPVANTDTASVVVTSPDPPEHFIYLPIVLDQYVPPAPQPGGGAYQGHKQQRANW